MVSYSDMVNFFSDDRGEPSGPCKMIMNREGEFIREMVRKTEKTGKEYIAAVVDITGKVGSTDMRQGEEYSITQRQSAQVNMDSMRVASDIKTTPGGSISVDYDNHQVHTHPAGHTGLSLRDMESFAEDITEEKWDSELVATMTERGISLGGVYIKEELSKEDVGDIQRSLSLVQSDKAIRSKERKKLRMLEEFEAAGLGFCSVLFPQR